MPKLKASELEIMNDHTKAMIGYCMFKNGMRHKDFAKAVGFSRKTAYNRFENPESYDLRELRRIIKKFNLNKEQIIELIGVEV